ncbi:MAG: helix-turn-helix transcriptional regulator [Clostridiales bacterium]|nr:helix-turn-helix transcriptional regulator [Clostridiales bacterium]
MDFFASGYENFCAAVDRSETPVLFCERFDERSSIWNFKEHTHDCVELIYFLYGNARVIAGDTSVQASFYDMIVYPKGKPHTEILQYDHHQEIICLWVDIPGLELEDIMRIQDKDARFKWLLENLLTEYKSKNPSKLLMDHYVKSIVLLIGRCCFDKSTESDMVSRVVLYMQDHLTESISVQQLADMVYVSKSYLSRAFKQKTGVTLMEYLNTLRMEAAKTMLAASGMNTEEIAYQTGYRSTKFFYRAFRTYTGMSTREYRKQEAASKAVGS